MIHLKLTVVGLLALTTAASDAFAFGPPGPPMGGGGPVGNIAGGPAGNASGNVAAPGPAGNTFGNVAARGPAGSKWRSDRRSSGTVASGLAGADALQTV